MGAPSNADIAILLSYYGCLLDKSSEELAGLYYHSQFPIEKLAEQEKISVKTCRKRILQIKKQLLELEARVHFVKRIKQNNRGMQAVSRLADEIIQGCDREDLSYSKDKAEILGILAKEVLATGESIESGI